MEDDDVVQWQLVYTEKNVARVVEDRYGEISREQMFSADLTQVDSKGQRGGAKVCVLSLMTVR